MSSANLPNAIADFDLLGHHRGVLLLVPVGAYVALSTGNQVIELELTKSYGNKFFYSIVDALGLDTGADESEAVASALLLFQRYTTFGCMSCWQRLVSGFVLGVEDLRDKCVPALYSVLKQGRYWLHGDVVIGIHLHLCVEFVKSQQLADPQDYFLHPRVD